MPITILTAGDLARIDQPEGPPDRRRLLSESTLALQPARLGLASPRLLRAPRGGGRRAVLIPGWRSPEAAMAPLVAYLRSVGHRAGGWGRGVNRGQVEELRDLVAADVDALVEADGRALNLVGWSLGGVIAREVARVRPDAVRRVVTYGTPAIGGPTHTVGAATFGPDECRRIRELQAELDRDDPIRVPITAVFTRRDGAVDWRACIDRSSVDVTMVEVSSSHVGLGLDPDVWLTVARALAEPAAAA